MAVVIPTWHSAAFVVPCVASVREQADVAVELLAVDNGSTDGTVRLLESEAVPHVALPRNVGFARAVNLAAARTRAPQILVLNVDATLEAGCLRCLVDSLSANPDVGAVQPRIRQAGVSPIRLHSTGQRMLKDGRGLERGAGDLDGPPHDVPREIFGVCGAVCLVRRELFTVTGGYDERFFAFHEDVDLNARARLGGWRFRYVPQAVAWHVGGAAWMTAPRRPLAFNAGLMARNRLATDIKVLPGRYFLFAAVAEVGSVLRSIPRGTLIPTLRGKLAALRWAPGLIRERRVLRGQGNAAALEQWLERPWGAPSWLARRVRRSA